jgi:hypothetical protein
MESTSDLKASAQQRNQQNEKAVCEWEIAILLPVK